MGRRSPMACQFAAIVSSDGSKKDTELSATNLAVAAE